MRSTFQNSAQFFAALVNAAVHHSEDPRLAPLAAAPSTVGQESTGADGGYLAPPDVRSDVARVVLGETSLLARTDRQTTASNSITIPADAAPAWATTGPQATLEPEGAALAQSKPALQGRTLRLAKLQATVPVNNELLEDAPGLAAYLRAVVPARMDFAINAYILNGDGVSKPYGVLRSGAKITQAAEGGQTAGTLNYANVTKMWARLYGPSKSRAVWVAHSSVEQQLQAMNAPAGTFVYPPEAPYPYLFGRPVLLSEAAQPLGTEGDLVLLDPLAYFSATRDPPVREDFSLHVFFDVDSSAFRFVSRIAGAPWWATPITQYRGAQTVSTIVSLAAR